MSKNTITTTKELENHIYTAYQEAVKQNVLETGKELETYVYDAYHDDDVELNSEFFDVQVKMPKKDILIAYANIQDTINGDAVVRLTNINLATFEGYVGRCDIDTTEVDLIPEGEYEDIYEGNCKDFLKSFNFKEEKTGIYRLSRYTRYEDKGVSRIAGGKLDLVFF